MGRETPVDTKLKTNNLATDYAVYGTLRTGESNARLWTGLAYSVGTTTMANFRLVTNGGFPYALFAEDESIVVELIRPIGNVEAQKELRSRLDRLEGYPDFYDRLYETVELDGDSQECWVYVPAGDQREYANLERVINNDWTEYCDQKWSA